MSYNSFLIIIKFIWSTKSTMYTMSTGTIIHQLHLCRRVRLSSNEYPGYDDIKLNLIVKLQSWYFGESGVHLYCHYYQVHLLRIVVPVEVLSRGQIELLNHLSRIIILSYFKPYSCVQIICIRLEYLINRIANVKLQYLKPLNSV